METVNLPLIDIVKDGEGNLNFKRLDNGEFVPGNFINVFKEPVIQIVHNKNESIMQMNHKDSELKANALLLEKEIDKKNHVYNAHYCKIDWDLSYKI